MLRATNHILDHYVHVPAGREIVVLCDGDKLALAESLCAGIAARGAEPLLLRLRDDLVALPALLDTLLANDAIGLIALASHRMFGAGLAARLDMGEGSPRLKAACAPCFFEAAPLDSVVRLYRADPLDTRAYAHQVKAKLPDGGRFQVTAPGGTALAFVARDWRIHDWEILTSPIEDSVEGVIVADASVFFARVQAPIALTIERGWLRDIHCADDADPVFRQYVRWLRDAVAANPANWRLAEVGVGCNAEAKLSGIIMEDETVRGTCHFCFGDNVRYGGANPSAWHGGTVVIHAPVFEERHVLSCAK